MIDIVQFRDLILRPTLVGLGLHSQAAENLLLGTAVQESGLRKIKQWPTGPALGVYQMEPATHDDHYETYLAYKPDLKFKVLAFSFADGLPDASELIGNLYYATAMSRVHYFRRPEPLPGADDIEGLAGYWKEHYNTFEGAGTTEEFVERWNEATFEID